MFFVIKLIIFALPLEKYLLIPKNGRPNQCMDHDEASRQKCIHKKTISQENHPQFYSYRFSKPLIRIKKNK